MAAKPLKRNWQGENSRDQTGDGHDEDSKGDRMRRREDGDDENKVEDWLEI